MRVELSLETENWNLDLLAPNIERSLFYMEGLVGTLLTLRKLRVVGSDVSQLHLRLLVSVTFGF